MIKTIEYRHIIKGISVDGIGTILITISGMLLIPYAVNILGVEKYGLWISISSVVGILGLIDLGIDQYIVSIVSGRESIDKKELNKEIISAIFLKSITVIVIIVAATIVFYNLEIFLKFRKEIGPDVSESYICCVIYLCFSMTLSVIQSFLFGFGRVLAISLITSGAGIIVNACTFYFLSMGNGMKSFPYAQIISCIFCIFCYAIIFNVKKRQINLSYAEIKFSKKMIKFSYSFQILKWAFVGRNQLINIIINNLCGPYYVTMYMIATKLPQILLLACTKITTPFSPSFGKFLGEENIIAAKYEFIKINKYVFAIVMYGAIAINFITEPFLKVWISPQFEIPREITLIATLSTFLLAMSALPTIVILASGNFKKTPAFALLELITAITLSSLLGSYFGLTGVMTGFLIGLSISTIYINHIVLDKLKITIRFYFMEFVIKNLIKNIAIIIYFYLIINYLSNIQLYELITVGIISAILFYIINIYGWKKE